MIHTVLQHFMERQMKWRLPRRFSLGFITGNDLLMGSA
jgi:hypothetical protein